MMFLESPALSAPKSEWAAWQNKLQKMKSNDPSVTFARKRAAAVLQQLEARDKAYAQRRVVVA